MVRWKKKRKDRKDMGEKKWKERGEDGLRVHV